MLKHTPGPWQITTDFIGVHDVLLLIGKERGDETFDKKENKR